ncbi:hypothetical protein RDWZM_009135 [Blomia tropicalis]|uniref:Nucleolar 27S pre-rRNA processing Urb2/Npa2 C-terminal domain-containing protein n=1 Tax=Blomia tropicalis TaxID=40697 RepID=A0A9Q0M3D4_BLOTA|nr:hypothetical protein RDWZM_009135 [Blomia tropicalis]
MEPILDSITKLVENLPPTLSEDNLQNINLESFLQQLKFNSRYLNLCQLFSHLHPDNSNGDERKIQFNCFLLKVTLDIMVKRQMFHIDLSNTENFNLESLYTTILNQLCSDEHFLKTGIELLSLVAKFDSSILNHSCIVDIFRYSIPVIGSNEEKLHYQRQLLTNLFNQSVQCRSLLRFHELFIEATSNLERIDCHDLGYEFNRLYSTNIFILTIKNSIDIWELFLKSYSSKNYFLIFLFGKFLSHIKINDDRWNKKQLISLVDKSENLVNKLKDERLLSIFYPLACIKYLLFQKYSDIFSDVNVQQHELYDQSYLFTQTKLAKWKTLEDSFDSLQHDTQILLIKMNVLKFQFIKLAAKDYCGFSKWNSSLHSILVKILANPRLICFDILYSILNDLNYKDLTTLMDYLFQHLIVEERINLEIVNLFSQSNTWENGPLQSIFITSFLKMLSQLLEKSKKRKLSNDDNIEPDMWSHLIGNEKVWAKHYFTIPNSASKEEKIYSILQETSVCFQNLTSESTVKCTNFNVLLQLLKFFNNSVPLEHLYPINQLRSILALSYLILSLKQSDQNEIAQLHSQFFQINLRIWDSVRSIWLFDFIEPNTYIFQILVKVQSGLDEEGFKLFSCLIANMFRIFDCPRSLRNVSKLIEQLFGSASTQIIKMDYIFTCLTLILQNNTNFLNKLQSRENLSEHVDGFELIGKNITSFIYKNIRLYIDESETELGNADSSEFLIQGLTKLFQYRVISDSHTTDCTMKTKWKKLLVRFISISLKNLDDPVNLKSSFIDFLRVIVENRNKLQSTLPDDLIPQVWSKIVQLEIVTDTELSNRSSKFQKKISSSSQWKKIYQEENLNGKFIDLSNELLSATAIHFSTQLDSYENLLTKISSLLNSIAESSTVEEFKGIINSCIESINRCTLVRSVFILNLLERLLESSNISVEKANILADNCCRTLTCFINLLLWCNKPEYRNDQLIQTKIRLKTIESSRQLLRILLAHDRLRNEHLFLIFNLCSESSIIILSNGNDLFPSMFQCLNNILFELIMRRPYLATFYISPLMCQLTSMLISLMTNSVETNFLNATDQYKLLMENCGKCFAQTLTQLANIGDDFKPYALHLIAIYLEQTPNHTVINFVRKHLQIGIYNLINLFVSDQSAMESFYGRLSQTSRELLKISLDQYERYHRFKGFV